MWFNWTESNKTTENKKNFQVQKKFCEIFFKVVAREEVKDKSETKKTEI